MRGVARNTYSMTKKEAESSESSDSEVGVPCVEDKGPGFVRSKFRNFWAPMFLAIFAELLLVLAIWKWKDMNKPVVADIWESRGEDPSGVFLPCYLYPAIFVACLVGRALTILAWKFTLFRGHDSQFSAIFMAFNCMQWIMYLALYFWLVTNITVRKGHMETVSQLMPLPNDLLPPEHRVPCEDNATYRDPEGHSCAYFAENKMKGPACGHAAVHCRATCDRCPRAMDRMRSCMGQGLNMYECTTEGLHAGMYEACKKEYVAFECAGYSYLPTEHNTSHVKCCVDLTMTLGRPVSDSLWTSKIKALSMGISDVFGMAKWVAILVMTWNLQETPFLSPSAASKAFMNGVWLDILDCFMFVQYLNNKKVMNPAFGLDLKGKALPEGEQPLLSRLIWYTWIMAASCAVLSPMVFTWFRWHESHVVAGVKKPHITKDTVLKEIGDRVHMLDREGARKALMEAFRMTQEDIQKEGEHKTRVVVRDEPNGSMMDRMKLDKLNQLDLEGLEHPDLLLSDGREGYAQREPNKVTYHVDYDDGTSEAGVAMEKIEPAEDQPHADDDQRCTGWCGVDFLNPDDEMTGIQRRATFLDAFRSLFTLEMPFFLFRLWFHWGDTSSIGVHLLTIKNGLFGFADILTLLACGNEEATIMGCSPAATISRFLAGHVTGAVRASGPGALMKKASQFALQAASADEKKLELKRAFLQQERYMAQMRDGEEVAKGYDEEMKKLDAQIAEQKEMLKHLHT